MTIKVDYHVCFCCDQSFKFKYSVKRDRLEHDTFLVDGAKADCTFVAKNTLRFRATCLHCGNDNTFEKEYKL